jgi:hypothetical protein
MQIHNPKHDEDFYGWSLTEANLLRQGKFHELDIKHLIEELECMGASEKRELISRMAQLLMHLLKWQFQPSLRGNSWRISIKKQRRGIQRIMAENPSLKSKLDGCLLDAYEDAKDDAMDETGLDEKTFPNACPYTLEQITNEEFFPE